MAVTPDSASAEDVRREAHRTLVWFALAAGGLVTARVAMAMAIWQPGWSALTWDDFTRVGTAQRWGEAPFLIGDLVWLPLPTWVNGLAFMAFGEGFATNPMALVAIVNTVAVILTAAVTGWTAWKIFHSATGTLATFGLVLFAPWGTFLGGSGLAEPLFYLAVAVAAASAISWVQDRHTWALAIGSAAVALSAAMRYEGWWLAAAWFGAVGWRIVSERGDGSVWRSLRTSISPLVVAAIPFLVPAWWMLMNWLRAGSPLHFAEQSGRIFLAAYGSDLFDSIPERILYYPAGLIRSAPLLVVVIALTTVILWQRLEVRHLVLLFGLQFALFYSTSLVSPAVGAFPERFLFSFALGLAPILGGLPRAIRMRIAPRWRGAIAVGLLVLALVVTGLRTADRPQEWTHAPDLLALTEALGTLSDEPILVAVGDRMTEDVVPIDVQNGHAVDVILGEGSPVSTDVASDLWIERNPERVIAFANETTPALGRYRLFGPLSDRLRVQPCPGCEGWTFVDENGAERPAPGNGFLAMEFVTDDPQPGSTVSLVTAIDRQDGASGHVDLRWLYGHGFNFGRLRVVVELDGRSLFTTDIGAPSRWTEVPFELGPDPRPAELRITVEAQPGIEQGWGWGRASTVLVRELELSTP